MKRKKVDPGAPLVGEIAVPGDKSISHRALMFAAAARGTSRIHRINTGEDVRWTTRSVALLGAATVVDDDKGLVEVSSLGLDDLSEPDDVVYAGNSGTTLRCMLGLCSVVDGSSVLSGDESLRARPMLRVVAPLRQMGARIDGRSFGDRAPLSVRGGALDGIHFDMSIASAQVKTAVLLAGLGAGGATTVVEPRPTRDHTERMLAAAGVEVKRDGLSTTVSGGSRPAAIDRVVPGDFSSAAFLIVGACLLEGSDLTITGVGLNPTRTGLLNVLARMGASVDGEPTVDREGEPAGIVRARHGPLTATEVAGEEVPGVIDELPVLAVAATQAEGETVIRGAGELRVKESNRIETVVDALRRLGGDVEALPDGMIVRGPTALAGAEVDSHGDHRVALALAVAGLVAEGNVRIKGWSSINTSFPEFLDVLDEARRGGR